MALADKLNKKHLSREQFCNDREVYKIVYDTIVDGCNKNNLHRREIPVRIHICAEDWVPDNELLTAAFKLKRKNVLKYYKKEVERLFKPDNQ